MKKINKTKVVGLFSVLITMFAPNTKVYAWPRNVSQIKGSYDCVRDGFKHLSPFKGYLWSQTKLAEHYYDFGNAKVDYDERGNVKKVHKESSNATIQLIHRLFYKDVGTFKCTIRNNITSHFNAEVIGKILAIIETSPVAELPKQLGEKISINSESKSDRKAAREIQKLIANSYKESTGENPKYLPYTTHNILLTFLYMSADETKYKDYFDQFSELNSKHGILEREFNSEDFFKRENEQQLTEEIKEKFSSQATWEEVEPFVLDHYELFFYTGIEQAINLIASWGTAYSRNYHFADCVETSIRNFINFLIYDQVSQTFKLPDTITASEELKGFYQEFNSPKKIHSQDAHDKWAEIVSNKNAEYTHNKTERYELESTLNNFMKIFNYLFGQEFENFDHFCSTFGIRYRLENPEKSDLDQYHNDNSFFIEKDGLRLFKLVIAPGHSEIYSTEEASDDTNTYKENILEGVENNDNILAQEICYIYRPDTLCNYRFATPDITYPARQHYYMQQNLESNSNLPVILKDTLKYKPFFWLAKKIFNKIQRLGDNGLISKAMTTILESGAWKENDEVKKIMLDSYQQLETYWKLEFLSTALRSGAWEKDKTIKKFIIDSRYQIFDTSNKYRFLQEILKSKTWENNVKFNIYVHLLKQQPTDFLDATTSAGIDTPKKFLETTFKNDVWKSTKEIKSFMFVSYQQLDASNKSFFLGTILKSGAWRDAEIKTILISFISSEPEGYKRLDDRNKWSFLEKILQSGAWKEDTKVKNVLFDFAYKQLDPEFRLHFLIKILKSEIWRHDETTKNFMINSGYPQLGTFEKSKFLQKILESGAWKDQTVKRILTNFIAQETGKYQQLSDHGKATFLQAIPKSEAWKDDPEIKRFMLTSYQQLYHYEKALFLHSVLKSDAWKDDEVKTILVNFISAETEGYQQLDNYGKSSFLRSALESDAWKDDAIKTILVNFISSETEGYQQLDDNLRKHFLDTVSNSEIAKQDKTIEDFLTREQNYNDQSDLDMYDQLDTHDQYDLDMYDQLDTHDQYDFGEYNQ
jgi:hypothetical protein